MLLEIDRGGGAEVEVEELGVGKVVEVPVVEAKVVVGGLLFVRWDGVQVGEVGGDVRRPSAGEVGHYGCRRLGCSMRRRLAEQSAPEAQVIEMKRRRFALSVVRVAWQ
jgi:hypothetical protein